MNPHSFPYKITQYPYQHPLYFYPQFLPQQYYPYNPYLHCKQPQFQQTQVPTQQHNFIIISDDEECVPIPKIEKPVPVQPTTTTQSQKKTGKVLDLDALEAQGKLYECEPSPPPPLPKRIIKKPSKPFYKPQKRRQIKTRKEPIRYYYQKVKHVQIGAERQQLNYPQSNVKAKFIRIYEKQEDKFSKLFEQLKLNHKEANDEDVAIILNMVDKDYQKAEALINENGILIQSIVQDYKDLSDDDSTIKK